MRLAEFSPKKYKRKFGYDPDSLAYKKFVKHIYPKKEAAGVGIITKQNATKDAPIGSEYANVKKLGLDKKPKKKKK
jgi:hypothetical protein|tara:strand:- start:8 stop:235 length:228 start_codon:yes stop_codon:yes gene_type:complete